MTKEEIIKNFDANGLAVIDELFGLPFDEEQSEVIVFPVTWGATVSYGDGTEYAPFDIREASKQVDLYHPKYPNGWQKGFFMLEPEEELIVLSNETREEVEDYLNFLVNDEADDDEALELLKSINDSCAHMIDFVESNTSEYLDKGKKVILLGGDHSTPLGYLKALAARNSDFGVLQIDAHADLRNAYEGFIYSHASIAYNFMKMPQIKKLVQVGIRDYCKEELDYAQSREDIKIFFDRDLKRESYEGKTWSEQCREIIAELPQKVYVSIDIDGLDPKLCPTTGTPVPGGFELEQVFFLLEMLKDSGKEIIGMDLNEVGSSEDVDDYDANVGSRLLFHMCNIIAH